MAESKLCCGFALPVHSAYCVKLVRSVAAILHMTLETKIRVYVFRWLTVVFDCTCARVENDNRRARHKIVSTLTSHRSFSHVLHACDYMSEIYHVEHAARRRCHSDYLSENTPSSHSTRNWIIIARVLTAEEYFVLGFHTRDINLISNSFFHSIIHTLYRCHWM